MSKRIDQGIWVATTLSDLIFHNVNLSGSVSIDTARMFYDQAIKETQIKYKVKNPTVLTKCTREIGFPKKEDFFQAVLEFIIRKSDTLVYRFTGHACADDNEWDIERRLEKIR